MVHQMVVRANDIRKEIKKETWEKKLYKKKGFQFIQNENACHQSAVNQA